MRLSRQGKTAFKGEWVDVVDGNGVLPWELRSVALEISWVDQSSSAQSDQMTNIIKYLNFSDDG